MPLHSLNEDVALSCGARIPILFHRNVSTLTPEMREMMSNQQLFKRRKIEKLEESIFYTCIGGILNGPSWFSLGLVPYSKKSSSTGFWLMKIPAANHYYPGSIHTLTSVGSCIYVMVGGGIETKDQFSKLKIFNCISCEWTETPPMVHTRKIQNCFLCAVEDWVVVVGGCVKGGEKGLTLNIEYINTKVGTRWDSVADPVFDSRNSQLSLVGRCEGNLLGVWLFSCQELQGMKYQLDLQTGSWKKQLSMVTPTLQYNHTVFVGDTIVRIYGSSLTWYDEELDRFCPVEGFKRLRKPPLGAVGSAGKLMVFGQRGRSKRGETSHMWAQEIILKKESGTVVSSLSWSEDKVLEVEVVDMGIKVLGCAYVTH